jgi:hypothetical protein
VAVGGGGGGVERVLHGEEGVGEQAPEVAGGARVRHHAVHAVLVAAVRLELDGVVEHPVLREEVAARVGVDGVHPHLAQLPRRDAQAVGAAAQVGVRDGLGEGEAVLVRLRGDDALARVLAPCDAVGEELGEEGEVLLPNGVLPRHLLPDPFDFVGGEF